MCLFSSRSVLVVSNADSHCDNNNPVRKETKLVVTFVQNKRTAVEGFSGNVSLRK